MPRIPQEGSEEARRRLPALLKRAHEGGCTIITHRGEPYAAIGPLSVLERQGTGMDIRDLRGSGKDYWDADVAGWIDRFREEWD